MAGETVVSSNKLYFCGFYYFLQSGILDALEKLNNLVDESDPDVDIPNIVHAFQTAERIRQDHPDLEWFHLTGLIHDLGKVSPSFSLQLLPYFS